MTHLVLPADTPIHADYAFQMEGQGMAAFGIWENDYIFFRAQDSASNGDTVLIVTEDQEYQPRLYYQSGSMATYQAADPSIPPIVARPGDSPQIIGKAVGVLRLLEPV